MGFWSSLVDGVANAGSWVVNNAGSIFSAVSTVAKVAGIVVTEEEIAAEGDNVVGTLHSVMDQAARKLKKKAKTSLKLTATASDQIRLGPFDLSALWPTTTTRDAPRVAPDLSADINRFLSLHKLPTVVGKGKNTEDLGQLLANQMFAESNMHTLDEDSNIQNIPVNIKLGDNMIQGTHVFYRIPLGNPGSNDEALHSHFRLAMTMPKTTYEELRMEKRMLAIQLPKGIGIYQDDKDSAYNAVTIAVSWTGTVGAPRIMKDAVERLIKSSKT